MDEAKKYAHAKRNPTLLLCYDSSGALLPGANVLQKPTVLLQRTTEIWIGPARQSAPLQALARLSINKGAWALVPRGLGWEISSAGVVYCPTVV